MSQFYIETKWRRPDSIEYPKVWHRFKARDVDSDELIEYRIEDLLEERAEEAFKHMKENYMLDEPISNASGGDEDIQHYEDYVNAWKSIFVQKTPLVCYKQGSDEIIGINWTFVHSDGDDFYEKFYEYGKSPATKTLFEAILALYENFDVGEHYGVDKYLNSLGLSVDRKYRGRGIGDQFMIARQFLCKEIGINITHTSFTSEFSARNADRAGFKTDVVMSYDEIMKIRPNLDLKKLKGTAASAKTLVY